VPFQKNTKFVGRTSELARIRALLASGTRCGRAAVIGLGGVGKIQVELKFIHQWREEHTDGAVFRIPFTSDESMLGAYLEIGQQLQIPNLQQQKWNVQELIYRMLSEERSGKWLVLYDNADDIKIWTDKADSSTGSGRLIRLPQSMHGCMLFTTRSRKVTTTLLSCSVVYVDKMNFATAKDLLEKRLIEQDLLDNDQITADLLLKLTHLSHAIGQVVASINKIQISPSQYSALLETTKQSTIDMLSEDFEDEGRYGNTRNSMSTTWLLSFEQTRNDDPLAAEYLPFMACVDHKEMPELLLPPAESAKKTLEAIRTLMVYSFVTNHKTVQMLDLHRLVHVATRNWLRSKCSLELWEQIAMIRLT
jgi:hypothetical protein